MRCGLFILAIIAIATTSAQETTWELTDVGTGWCGTDPAIPVGFPFKVSFGSDSLTLTVAGISQTSSLKDESFTFSLSEICDDKKKTSVLGSCSGTLKNQRTTFSGTCLYSCPEKFYNCEFKGERTDTPMDGSDTSMDGSDTPMDGSDTSMDGSDTPMDGDVPKYIKDIIKKNNEVLLDNQMKLKKQNLLVNGIKVPTDTLRKGSSFVKDEDVSIQTLNNINNNLFRKTPSIPIRSGSGFSYPTTDQVSKNIDAFLESKRAERQTVDPPTVQSCEKLNACFEPAPAWADSNFVGNALCSVFSTLCKAGERIAKAKDRTQKAYDAVSEIAVDGSKSNYYPNKAAQELGEAQADAPKQVAAAVGEVISESASVASTFSSGGVSKALGVLTDAKSVVEGVNNILKSDTADVDQTKMKPLLDTIVKYGIKATLGDAASDLYGKVNYAQNSLENGKPYRDELVKEPPMTANDFRIVKEKTEKHSGLKNSPPIVITWANRQDSGTLNREFVFTFDDIFTTSTLTLDFSKDEATERCVEIFYIFNGEFIPENSYFMAVFHNNKEVFSDMASGRDDLPAALGGDMICIPTSGKNTLEIRFASVFGAISPSQSFEMMVSIHDRYVPSKVVYDYVAETVSQASILSQQKDFVNDKEVNAAVQEIDKAGNEASTASILNIGSITFSILVFGTMFIG
jgi:hypothetical protein